MMAEPKAMESVVRSNDENASRQPNLSRSLEIIEYLSLAASVVGVGISAVVRQAVYAAAPLSVAVFLNLINRKRFEQETQKSLTATVDQTEQQLSQLSHDFSDFQQQVKGELTRALNSFPQQSLTATVNQTEQQLSQLSHDFSDFQQQVKDELAQQRSQIAQDLTRLATTKQASSSLRENKQLQTDKQQKRSTQQPALSRSSQERVKEKISNEKATEVETLLEFLGLGED